MKNERYSNNRPTKSIFPIDIKDHSPDDDSIPAPVEWVEQIDKRNDGSDNEWFNSIYRGW